MFICYNIRLLIFYLFFFLLYNIINVLILFSKYRLGYHDWLRVFFYYEFHILVFERGKFIRGFKILKSLLWFLLRRFHLRFRVNFNKLYQTSWWLAWIQFICLIIFADCFRQWEKLVHLRNTLSGSHLIFWDTNWFIVK